MDNDRSSGVGQFERLAKCCSDSQGRGKVRHDGIACADNVNRSSQREGRHALGLPIEEIPTTWRDRTAGASRFQLWQWIPHYLRWYGYGMRTRLGRRGRQRVG